MIQLTHVN